VGFFDGGVLCGGVLWGFGWGFLEVFGVLGVGGVFFFLVGLKPGPRGV